MTLNRRCRSLLLSCVMLCAAAPSAAQETPPTESVDEARERFHRGVELFREGNFRAALIEFRRANEIAPNYRIQFNLGQTYFELQDYAGAMKAFETYLREGGDEISATRKAEVAKELDKLRARVARLSISADVDGAEIHVDDTVVGTTPLDGPVLVSAGRRKISATKGPGTPTVKFVDVAGGDSLEVKLELKVEPRAPAAATAAAPPPQPQPAAIQPEAEGMGTAFWVSLVATGVLATGATVSGIMAAGAKSDYDSALDAYPTTSSDIQEARDDTNRLALTTDILGGAAVVAGVLTIVFAASGSNEPNQVSSNDVRLNLGPASMAIDGRF